MGHLSFGLVLGIMVQEDWRWRLHFSSEHSGLIVSESPKAATQSVVYSF